MQSRRACTMMTPALFRTSTSSFSQLWNLIGKVSCVKSTDAQRFREPSYENRLDKIEDHLLALNTHLQSSNETIPHEMLKSVVKVFCQSAPVNHFLPWQKKNQGSSTGSGFVLDKSEKLVITNAHVVFSATFIEVRRHGESTKFTATLRYISADCDLALLLVDDPAFWEATEELEFAGVQPSTKGTSNVHRVSSVGYVEGLPNLQQSTKVLGYPCGGDELSITSGVVSRIDSTPFCGIDVNLIAIQIDAAINPGNSGGPAICDKVVVGIAFQSLLHGENIGYIIPVPIIAHFLRSYVRHRGRTDRFTPGHYHEGFCSLGSFVQELHNSSLRKQLNIPPDRSGVLLLDILPNSSASKSLQQYDVVTQIESHPMRNDGTMKFRGERLRFAHFIQMRDPKDVISVEIIRNGKLLNTKVELSVNWSLVPNHLFSQKHCEKPNYVLFGGCLFTHLTLPLLLEWSSNDWVNMAPRHLTQLVFNGKVTSERDEVVVLVQMFPHEVNKGYGSELQYRIVSKIGATRVKNLAHFSELLNAANTAYIDISLQNIVNTQLLVLPVEASRTADRDIQAIYNFPESTHLSS